MPSSCVIKNCDRQNKHLKNRGLFQFPKDMETKKCWLSVIPRNVYHEIRQESRICCLHFEEKFLKPLSGKKLSRSRLTLNAIPSLCFYFEKPSSTSLTSKVSSISNDTDPNTHNTVVTLTNDSSSISNHLEDNSQNIESLTIKNEMICRGCLCDDVELLESFLDKPSLLDMYVGCTFLQVEIGDGLPMNLCLNCKSKCTAWYSFKQFCEQNESLLRGKSTTNPIIINQISEKTHNIEHTKIKTIDSICDLEIPTTSNNNFNSEITSIKNSNLFRKNNLKIEFFDVEDNTNSNPAALLTKPQIDVTVTNKNASKITSKRDMCYKLFSNPISLKNHKVAYKKKYFQFGKTCESESYIERPFKCDICNKDFAEKSYLKKHIYHIHDKRFSCVICRNKFRTQFRLNDHMRKHTDEKPFECDICNKLFINSKNLYSHKLSHSDQRKFLCSICGKTFKKCSNYKDHLLTHTDERAFNCTICNRSFKTKTNLTKHSVIHRRILFQQFVSMNEKSAEQANQSDKQQSF